jgi:hypothetical protein
MIDTRVRSLLDNDALNGFAQLVERALKGD